MSRCSKKKSDESGFNENYISLSEALQNADSEFALVYNSTRSDKRVVDTELFQPKTRSEEDDLYGYYVVNYDNGFAMLSADRRRPAVLALSDEGSMHLSDTTYNDGLNWYINEALSSFGSTIVKPDTTIHSTYPNEPYTTTTTVYSERLLTGFLSTFSQRYPYNIYCYTDSAEQAVVGCTPLAVGTVMGYYKWPESYESYTFDWTSMYSSSMNTMWARLFEILGRSENLHSKYGTSSTSTPIKNIAGTINRLGYKNAEYVTFNQTRLQSELSKNNPVIMNGFTTRTDPTTNEEKTVGHTWIIDGGYSTKTPNQLEYGGGKYTYRYYYHCVWGWGGTANGYFILKSTDTSIGGTPYEPDTSTSGSADVYKNLSMICGYTPNK
jgi:hypothetical protein